MNSSIPGTTNTRNERIEKTSLIQFQIILGTFITIKKNQIFKINPDKLANLYHPKRSNENMCTVWTAASSRPQLGFSFFSSSSHLRQPLPARCS